MAIIPSVASSSNFAPPPEEFHFDLDFVLNNKIQCAIGGVWALLAAFSTVVLIFDVVGMVQTFQHAAIDSLGGMEIFQKIALVVYDLFKVIGSYCCFAQWAEVNKIIDLGKLSPIIGKVTVAYSVITSFVSFGLGLKALGEVNAKMETARGRELAHYEEQRILCYLEIACNVVLCAGAVLAGIALFTGAAAVSPHLLFGLVVVGLGLWVVKTGYDGYISGFWGEFWREMVRKCEEVVHPIRDSIAQAIKNQ